MPEKDDGLIWWAISNQTYNFHTKRHEFGEPTGLRASPKQTHQTVAEMWIERNREYILETMGNPLILVRRDDTGEEVQFSIRAETIINAVRAWPMPDEEDDS